MEGMHPLAVRLIYRIYSAGLLRPEVLADLIHREIKAEALPPVSTEGRKS